MQNLPVSSHSVVLTFHRGQAAEAGAAAWPGLLAWPSPQPPSPRCGSSGSCADGCMAEHKFGRFPPPLPAWSQSVTSNEAYDWWRGVSCSHMACVCPGAKLDTCNCFMLCHLLCLPWQSYWRELLTWRCCHSRLSPAVFLLTSHTMKCCQIWGGGSSF